MRRTVSLLVAPLALALAMGLAATAGSAATARGAEPAFPLTASAISLPSGDDLTLDGWAPLSVAGLPLEGQVDVGGRWTPVATGSVDEEGEVSLPVPSYLGLQEYRVVVLDDGQPVVSQQVQVLGTLNLDHEVQAPDMETETVTGRFPEALVRPVALYSEANESGGSVTEGMTDEEGRLSITKATRVGEFIWLAAPAVTVGDVSVPAYRSPNLVVSHPALPHLVLDGPHAVVRAPYCADLDVTDIGQDTLAIDPGVLPPGLGFDGRRVCGRPTTAGVTTVPVTVTNENGTVTTASVRIVVDRQQAVTRADAARVVTPQGGTLSPYVSGDGRYVAYSGPPASSGTESPTTSDVFVWDGVTGARTEVSRAVDGGAADADSFVAGMSGDGRFVAFTSLAHNLVTDEGGGRGALLLWDRTTGTTRQVAPARANLHGAVSVSDDGDIVYSSRSYGLVDGDEDPYSDVFLWTRATGALSLLSATAAGAPANSDSDSALISRDGRVVMYESYATDLVAGSAPSAPGPNPVVYSVDRATGVTTAMPRPAAWARQVNLTGVSDDGRYVAVSWLGVSANTKASVWDRQQGSFVTVPMPPLRVPGDLASVSGFQISGDGRYVTVRETLLSPTAYVADAEDVWRYDCATGTFVRVDGPVADVPDPSAAGDVVLSSDGRYVVYTAESPIGVIRADVGVAASS